MSIGISFDNDKGVLTRVNSQIAFTQCLLTQMKLFLLTRTSNSLYDWAYILRSNGKLSDLNFAIFRMLATLDRVCWRHRSSPRPDSSFRPPAFLFSANSSDGILSGKNFHYLSCRNLRWGTRLPLRDASRAKVKVRPTTPNSLRKVFPQRAKLKGSS